MVFGTKTIASRKIPIPCCDLSVGRLTHANRILEAIGMLRLHLPLARLLPLNMTVWFGIKACSPSRVLGIGMFRLSSSLARLRLAQHDKIQNN